MKIANLVLSKTAMLLSMVVMLSSISGSVAMAYSDKAAQHRNEHSIKESYQETKLAQKHSRNTTVVTEPTKPATLSTKYYRKVSVPTRVVAPTPANADRRPVPGDNGTVKVHQSTTTITDRRNEPKVCKFYLDAFGFDGIQNVSWYIMSHPHGSKMLDDTIRLNANGNGSTKVQTLPDGMYKLYWNFVGEHGAAKHKVFKVSCGHILAAHTDTPETPTPGAKGAEGESTPAGHVLGSATVTANDTKLVNTGDSFILSTLLASMLMSLGLLVAFRRSNKQQYFDSIAL